MLTLLTLPILLLADPVADPLLAAAARPDTVAPVSENVVSGLIYIVAMVIAASLTQVTSMISAMWSVAIVVGLLVLELGLFAGCVARAWSPTTAADQAGLLVSPRQRGSVS